MSGLQIVEKYNIFEKSIIGPKTGNPFVDVNFSVRFINGHVTKEIEGFYDGDGVYIVRFMPEFEGTWEYKTISNVKELNKISGEFKCISASQGNHGPVRVKNIYHFAYDDGEHYFPFGTTCYAWIHQNEGLKKETLQSLANSCFNKVRMCVFPKYYSNNRVEPEFYPFEGEIGDWDFERFNPKFFRNLENEIKKLMDMGIEADLILFHPYDKGHWGFDQMSRETDIRYLHYVIARLAAYKNIWWSMANEYDYMKLKSKENWDEYIELVSKLDQYNHLLSIHQADILYDYWKSNITHASVQIGYVPDKMPLGTGFFRMLRDAYRKPVIYDEIGYEGNLPQRWGKLTAEQLVDKFWKAVTSGTYATHGETFQDPNEIIWWAKGGKLKGESAARIEFLKSIVEESGLYGLEPLDSWWILNSVGRNGDYYLYYFGDEELDEWKFELPGFKMDAEVPIGTKFKVDIIDTWNMTVTPAPDIYEVTDKDKYNCICRINPVVKLPGRKMMALRIKKIGGE